MTDFEPHPVDANVTLPLCFFTVTLKFTDALPLTVTDVGVTWICPVLLDVAVRVPEPVALFRWTLIFPEPSLTTVNELSGLDDRVQAAGVGVAVGVGVGYAVGVGVGYAVGVGVGVG